MAERFFTQDGQRLADLSKLRLQPGLAINLEIANDDQRRFKSTLLGYVTDRSVLVSTPMLGENRPLLLRKDQMLICRFFAHKAACAFRAPVLHLCTTPLHYLHLGWPTEVEVGEIRNAERVIANLNVNILNLSDPDAARSQGAIVDLSTTGARLESLDPIGVVGDRVQISGKVVVGHVTRLVTLEGEIRAELNKFAYRNSTAAYGVSFNYLSDVDFLALQAFVKSQLTDGAGL